jgi:putative folate metabolism gamma-glutamate ligase
MIVTAYRSPVVNPGDDLFKVLKTTLPTTIPEKSVIAVTSKIVALAENRVEPVMQDNHEHKNALIRQEAEFYTEPTASKYGVMLTVKNSILAVNAGIDESNTNGFYVLWPKDCQKSANEIWNWIRSTYGVKDVGVIITDSKTTPLYWGVTGAAVSHCGFSALNDKRQTPDIFGRDLQMTQVNVAQGVAAAAVLEMGETKEQTPVAIINEIPEIHFQSNVPSTEDLNALKIELEDDVFAPILTKAEWKTGGAK